MGENKTENTCNKKNYQDERGYRNNKGNFPIFHMNYQYINFLLFGKNNG